MTAAGPLRLSLISHAATAQMRQGQMPHADALDQRGQDEARQWAARQHWPAHAQVWTSPAPCAVATAQALGLQGEVAAALDEIDYGRWKGLRLSTLAQHEPEALGAWLQDPDMATHGGEPFSAAVARVGRWLEQLDPPPGREVLAVTHATVIRAAVVHALGAAPSMFRQIEVAPLSLVRLQRSPHSDHGWRLALAGS